jgi:hypothetical protein
MHLVHLAIPGILAEVIGIEFKDLNRRLINNSRWGHANQATRQRRRCLEGYAESSDQPLREKERINVRIVMMKYQWYILLFALYE